MFPAFYSCTLCLTISLKRLIGCVLLKTYRFMQQHTTKCLLPCPQLTVLESLVFSARLRHPASTPVRTVYAFVGEVRTPARFVCCLRHWPISEGCILGTRGSDCLMTAFRP